MSDRLAVWLRLAGEHLLDLMFTAAMIIAMFAMGIYTAQSAILDGAALLPGSSINGVDVSGMDPDRARELVIQQEEARLLGQVSLKLSAGAGERSYRAEDLGAFTDARERVDELFAQMLKGGMLSRTNAYYRVRDGAQVDIAVLYDAEKVEETCRAFCALFYKPPENASVKLAGDGKGFDYISDQNGAQVDFIDLFHAAWAQLESGESATVQVQIKAIPAAVSEVSLRESIMALSTCETELAVEEGELARTLLDAVNGYVLSVGGTIDLKALLYQGVRVPAQEQAVVSQIAGTLYDALLLAGANKVERHPNARPVEYLPIGLDAALDDAHNLIMRNDARFPLYVLAAWQEGKIKIEVHGRPGNLDETVRIRSVIVKPIEPPSTPLFIDDPTLPAGKQQLVTAAQEGYRVSSYREVLRDGKVVINELLAMDVYPAVQEVYNRGSAP